METVKESGDNLSTVEASPALARVKLKHCECWSIEPSKGLDEIHVFWMNVATGKGYVTIICYGEAWTAFWGSMGDRTVQQFFARADAGYLFNNLGIKANLKQSQRHGAYLTRIIVAVQSAIAEHGAARATASQLSGDGDGK